MRKSVSTNLVLVAGSDAQYSEACPTDGLNGVSMDLTILSWYSSANMTFAANLQQSADLQTWTDVYSALAVTYAGTASIAPAYTSVATTALSTLSTKFVRVKYTATMSSGTGQICVAAGLNFFSFAS